MKPSGLSHAEIWSAIDALATRLKTTPSGLAKIGELDRTSFNRSKRHSAGRPPRERWPSTESIAKVLAATGVSRLDDDAVACATHRQHGIARYLQCIDLRAASWEIDFIPTIADGKTSGGDRVVVKTLEGEVFG